jgi:hypothetical protein
MNASGFSTLRTTAPEPRKAQDPCGSSRIRALIDEATTDSHDESDEHAGLMSMIKEEVCCPFSARIGEVEVECLGFQCPQTGYGMNAVCRSKKGKTHVVDVAKLDLVDPRPRGYEWIEAYFAWRGMQD